MSYLAMLLACKTKMVSGIYRYTKHSGTTLLQSSREDVKYVAHF